MPGAADLDVTGRYDTGTGSQGTIALREVLVHMIEEYARHEGHDTPCAGGSTEE